MTARKRKSNETFEEYKKNLKAESKELEDRLTGKPFFISKPNPFVRGRTYRKERRACNEAVSNKSDRGS